MKVNDLVRLTWEDSIGCPQGWVYHTDIDPPNVLIISSVGWVREVNKNFVQLVPHVAHNNGHIQCMQGYMTVPRSGVIESKILENAT